MTVAPASLDMRIDWQIVDAHLVLSNSAVVVSYGPSSRAVCHDELEVRKGVSDGVESQAVEKILGRGLDPRFDMSRFVLSVTCEVARLSLHKIR